MGDTERVMKFSSLGDWVARVGIPAAIAFILLWQTNAKLDNIGKGIERITVMMETREGTGVRR